jgi:hypothetical protein
VRDLGLPLIAVNAVDQGQRRQDPGEVIE